MSGSFVEDGAPNRQTDGNNVIQCFLLSFQKPADNQDQRQVGHAGADKASDSEVEQVEVLMKSKVKTTLPL